MRLGILPVLFLIAIYAQTPSVALAADKANAQVEAENLTLEAVLAYTYTRNPTLRAARAELRAVNESLPQAYAGWKPSVEANSALIVTDIEGGNFGGDGSTSKDFELAVDQPVYRGGRTWAESAAARSIIKAQRASVLQTEQDILLSAASAYMDVVRDRSVLDLRQNNRRVIAEQLEATRARFKYGELTRTDVSQAESRLADAEAAVIEAEASLERSEGAFTEITGLNSGILDKPYLEFDLPENREDYIHQARNTAPGVLAAVNLHRASEKNVDANFRELLPQIGIFSSWNRTYDPAPGIVDEQTTATFGLSASLPLYQAGAVRSRVREAKHTANQRYMQIVEARKRAAQQAVSAWAGLLSSRAQIQARSAQVKSAGIAREGVKKEEELGARTILDTLNADQEYLDAQVALVSADRDYIVAQFQVLAVLGELTPQNLGFPYESYNYEGELQKSVRKVFDMHVDRIDVSE